MLGMMIPSFDLIARGISIPKYNTPLYGQNAKAKIIPNNKISQYLKLFLFENLFENLSENASGNE